MATQETFTQEELQHYLEHPDEVDATNIALVEALALQEEQSLLGDKEDGEANGEGDDGQAVIDQAAAQAAADKAAAPKGAEEVQGNVLAPDGKNTIPYTVLKDTRERATAAEQALADAQRQLLAVSERYQALKEGRDPGEGGQPTADELDGIVEAVEGEAPWLKDTVSKLVGAVRSTIGKLAEIEDREREGEEQQLQRYQSAADQALANNPTLVLWQSQAPKLFEEAVKFDTAIRQDEESRARFPTFEKRYEQVVKLVQAMHEGEAIPLPQPVAPGKPAKTSAKPSAEEVKTAAKAALAEADKAAEGTSVVTLSDIPGGDMPNDPLSILERSNPVDLANHFAKKSPQDIVSFVMNGGRG